MSRSNLGVGLIFGLMLASTASLTWAQGSPRGIPMPPPKMDDAKLVDVNAIPVKNDPVQVDLLFKEGSTITSILDELNEKGFHIEYREKQFLPTMTLLRLPDATAIDDVLQEILEPWNFRTYRTPFGKVVVVPITEPAKKRKVEILMQDGQQQTPNTTASSP